MYSAVVPKSSFNPKVDAYINKAASFAQPVLTHLRELIHKACPDVKEEIKWSRPFFVHRNAILCNISGFKAHCSVGFWGAEMASVLSESGIVQDSAMGSLGRITSLKDLPPDKELVTYIRRAAAFIEQGDRETVITQRRVVKTPKPALEASPEFIAALKKNKTASAAYTAFSPSCKREYVEWIADAKRPETRDRRITQAIEWIADGKRRNWKYQNC
jgi:uncharacterized protein YdeI (YjbR/CyaY-like superfamily)